MNRIVAQTPPTPTAFEVRIDNLNLPQPERSLASQQAFGKGFVDLRRAFISGADLATVEIPLECDKQHQRLLGTYRERLGAFIEHQEESVAAYGLDASGLSSLHAGLTEAGIAAAMQRGEIRVQHRAPGLYMVLSDERDPRLLTKGSQALAGVLNNGVAVLVLKSERAGLPNGYYEECVPHEAQHLLWKACEPYKTVRALAARAVGGDIDISAERLDFAMFRDEALARMAGGTYPLAYGVETVMDIEVTPEERVRLAETRGRLNDLMHTLWERAGKGAQAEQALIAPLVLSRDFRELEAELGRLDAALPKEAAPLPSMPGSWTLVET